jgi:general stress protein YciG
MRESRLPQSPGELGDQEEGAMAHERKGRRRGFAAMDPKKQREIASKGGRAAHEHGSAHEWTSDEARMAGRKGGGASRRHEMEVLISS